MSTNQMITTTHKTEDEQHGFSNLEIAGCSSANAIQAIATLRQVGSGEYQVPLMNEDDPFL